MPKLDINALNEELAASAKFPDLPSVGIRDFRVMCSKLFHNIRTLSVVVVTNQGEEVGVILSIEEYSRLLEAAKTKEPPS